MATKLFYKAWVSPDGEVHDIGEEEHGYWANKYILKDPSFDDILSIVPRALNEGWTRINLTRPKKEHGTADLSLAGVADDKILNAIMNHYGLTGDTMLNFDDGEPNMFTIDSYLRQLRLLKALTGRKY